MKKFINDETILESKRTEIKKLLKDKKLHEANTLIRSLNYYEIFEVSSYKIECLELLLNSKKFESRSFEKLFEILGWYTAFLNQYKILEYDMFNSEKSSYVSYINREEKEGYSTGKYVIEDYIQRIPKVNKDIVNTKKYKGLLQSNIKNLSLNNIKVLIKNEDLVKELIEEDKNGIFSLNILKIINESKFKDLKKEKIIELKNRIINKGIKDFFENDCLIVLEDLQKEELELLKKSVSKYMFNNLEYFLKQKFNKINEFKKYINYGKIKINYLYIEKNINKLLNETETNLTGLEIFCCIFDLTVDNLFEELEENNFWNIKKVKQIYEKERYVLNLENF